MNLREDQTNGESEQVAAGTRTVAGFDGPQLDVAALMRDAINAQQPGEDIVDTLRRIMEATDLEGADMICRVVAEYLRVQEWRFNISKAQAARQLAQADAQLRITPDGQPFLDCAVMSCSGLEALPACMRQQVLERIQKQARQIIGGGPLQPIVIRSQPPVRVGWPLLTALLVSLSYGLAFLLFRR